MSASKSKYITLVSTEGFEFVLLRDAAICSPMIKKMISPHSGFSEALSGRVVFPEINAIILGKVVEYFQYWYRYQEREDVPDMDIPVDLCLEMLMAADFLGIERQS